MECTKLDAAESEVAQAVDMLKGVAKLRLLDNIVEQTQTDRTVTRHVPVGTYSSNHFPGH